MCINTHGSVLYSTVFPPLSHLPGRCLLRVFGIVNACLQLVLSELVLFWWNTEDTWKGAILGRHVERCYSLPGKHVRAGCGWGLMEPVNNTASSHCPLLVTRLLRAGEAKSGSEDPVRSPLPRNNRNIVSCVHRSHSTAGNTAPCLLLFTLYPLLLSKWF